MKLYLFAHCSPLSRKHRSVPCSVRGDDFKGDICAESNNKHMVPMYMEAKAFLALKSL